MSNPSGRRVLAIIPARGGSKGIPRKNIRPFLGRPLLAWSVDAALRSGAIERVVLSTEDDEIARIGRACGAEVPFARPVELAGDQALTAAVVRHAVDWLERHDAYAPDAVVVLEPTAPARTPSHIRESLALLFAEEADSAASISEVPHHYNPEKALTRGGDGEIRGIGGRHIRAMTHRRQDLPPYYAFNGLVFACRTGVIRSEPPTLWGDRVVGYVVDSKYNLDIDTPADWIVAEARTRILREEEAAG